MKFDELGLSLELLKAIEKLGFEKPTQIQEQSIPSILEGKDVMGESATGSGKTSFLRWLESQFDDNFNKLYICCRISLTALPSAAVPKCFIICPIACILFLKLANSMFCSIQLLISASVAILGK